MKPRFIARGHAQIGRDAEGLIQRCRDLGAPLCTVPVGHITADPGAGPALVVRQIVQARALLRCEVDLGTVRHISDLYPNAAMISHQPPG